MGPKKRPTFTQNPAEVARKCQKRLQEIPAAHQRRLAADAFRHASFRALETSDARQTRMAADAKRHSVPVCGTPPGDSDQAGCKCWQKSIFRAAESPQASQE